MSLKYLMSFKSLRSKFRKVEERKEMESMEDRQWRAWLERCKGHQRQAEVVNLRTQATPTSIYLQRMNRDINRQLHINVNAAIIPQLLRRCDMLHRCCLIHLPFRLTFLVKNQPPPRPIRPSSAWIPDLFKATRQYQVRHSYSHVIVHDCACCHDHA